MSNMGHGLHRRGRRNLELARERADGLSGPTRRRGADGARASACRLSAPLGDVAQLLRLGQRLQLLQRLVLDLADALARDVEGPPDLVERARVLPAESVAQLEHAALAVAQVLERLAERL